MIRVVVADDQTLVRDGLCAILAAQPDIEIVGEAKDGLEAIELTREQRPDVVLMDIRMPRLDGLEATRRILDDRSLTGTRVLALTTFDRNAYLYEALKAGASGFLLKDTPAERLADGIRTVASGEALLAPTITRRLIEDYVRRPSPDAGLPPRFDKLSQRELEVVRLIARGRSNTEIAAELYVSSTTVKSHVASILAKLQLRDRIQVVVLAYESGLVQHGVSPT